MPQHCVVCVLPSTNIPAIQRAEVSPDSTYINYGPHNSRRDVVNPDSTYINYGPHANERATIVNPDSSYIKYANPDSTYINYKPPTSDKVRTRTHIAGLLLILTVLRR